MKSLTKPSKYFSFQIFLSQLLSNREQKEREDERQSDQREKMRGKVIREREDQRHSDQNNNKKIIIKTKQKNLKT